MLRRSVPPPLRLTYLFTTFPKATETFLQREVSAMRARGVELRLYSLWGGGPEFEGVPVRCFNKWRLLTLVWQIPSVAVRHPRFFFGLCRGLCTRPAKSWLNFWENMLGAGFAALFQQELRRDPPEWLHAAWAGAPATAAWCLQQMEGYRFSSGAHAYDIYEHGGDWWLLEKLAAAAFIHTSTEMARQTLIGRGVSAERIHRIPRGLATFPARKALRAQRSDLRIVCVARLVAKKGFPHQLRIWQKLRDAGRTFSVRIIGEGPERTGLEAEVATLGLSAHVAFLGHLPQPDVWAQLAWADVLVHTGVIAPSGDRDGLPNVIPEAMAAGTLVVTSPAAATTEAIAEAVTGWVVPVEDTAGWVDRLESLAEAPPEALAPVQARARAWVEEHFDAHRNAARLHSLFLAHARP